MLSILYALFNGFIVRLLRELFGFQLFNFRLNHTENEVFLEYSKYYVYYTMPETSFHIKRNDDGFMEREKKLSQAFNLISQSVMLSVCSEFSLEFCSCCCCLIHSDIAKKNPMA